VIQSAMVVLAPNLVIASIAFTTRTRIRMMTVYAMIIGQDLIVASLRVSVMTSAMDVMVLVHVTVKNVLKMPILITMATAYANVNGAATSVSST